MFYKDLLRSAYYVISTCTTIVKNSGEVIKDTVYVLTVVMLV
jgi:hypothetical protein